MAITSGTRLGPYEIAALIGSGGMGEVYWATDTRLKRQVAVKVLPEALASDAERLARFQREAEVLASLNHPNIAIVHGLEQSDGVTALVMELVEGPTLADRIAQGPISLEEALAIAGQIAEALEAAHEQGVIHRDLKPANIKVRDDGTVKVLDFGLAKAIGPAAAGVTTGGQSMSPTITTPAMTQAGLILGTAAYMSPEQARGKPVDRRADIWAFGVVLFEMLTGRRAFKGEDVSLTLAAVMKAEPDWDALPGGLSPVLRSYLERCLEKDPRERVQAIGDLRLALGGAFDASVHTSAVGGLSHSRSVWSRAAAVGLAFSILMGLVVALVIWTMWRPDAGIIRLSISPSERMHIANASPDVAISPDGRHVAFLTGSVGAGGAELRIRSLDQLESATLVAEGELNSPFFSPDGDFVAFYDRSGQPPLLRRVPVRGGPASTIARLTGDMRGATWGADGTIVFATADATTGLWRVPAFGGEPELLTTFDPAQGEVDHAWPEFLPGANAVLFTAMANPIEDSRIAVLSLETREQKVLIRGGTFPRYAPTGHLVYHLRGNLWAVPFDPRRARTLGDPVPVQQSVLNKPSGAADYAFSEAGALVYVPEAFATTDDSGVLALIDRNGVETLLPVREARYRGPRFSPNGQRLAVEILDAGGVSDVWVYDLAGDSAIRRLSQSGTNTRPIWTPDGERITFGSDRGGTWGIYEQPADGSAVAEILTMAGPDRRRYPESWSPDGQTLAFVEIGGTGNWDLWTFSRRTGDVTPLAGGELANQFGAAFSPNGRWLVYTDGAAPFGIRAQPFPPTRVVRQITQDGEAWPVWSADGGELFFRLRRDGGEPAQLRGITVGTSEEFTFGNTRTLPIEGALMFQNYRDYDLAPDTGQFVVILPSERLSDTRRDLVERPRIDVVLNWFETLRELSTDTNRRPGAR